MFKIFRIISRTLRSTIPSTNPSLSRSFLPSPSRPCSLLPTQRLNPKSFKCPHCPTCKIRRWLQFIKRHILNARLIRTWPHDFPRHLSLLLHSFYLRTMPGCSSSVFLGEFLTDLILTRTDLVLFYSEMDLMWVFIENQVLF